MNYDVIVIGAGPAGYIAAERAGQAGKKALLIEREEHLGGVCLNWGCIPTKTLLACSKAYYTATHGATFGVEIEKASFRLELAQTRKASVQDQLRAGIRALMKKYKVDVVQGEARIVARGQVAVGDEVYQGDNILVCSGSRPAAPPIPGADQAHVLDSTGILGLEKLPDSLAIIGGGVIGVEFACFFAQVGVPVTVIEMMDEIVPGIDIDCAKTLRQELTKKGITFELGAKVTGIGQGDISFTDKKGAEKTAAASTVLVCTGRVANVEGLGLAELGVDHDRRGIKIDTTCKTNVPGIWACGDVTGTVMLAHVASRQAEVAINTICGLSDHMRYRAIPGVVYTSPEIAGAGITEAQAKERDIPVKTAKLPLQINGRFLAEYEGRGLCKVVVHAETRQLLGVHIVGASASEIIHAACVMIESETRVDELKEFVLPHPTAGEIMRDAVFTI
ncbi:MAG: dihydrolipoyl dehydrogenase [Planctomycetota bacterium]|jgi:dihydrolipoamide dehydrogenase|nr:dihydrolipoyl dehydrogenase [Planctomycetota bacterium]